MKTLKQQTGRHGEQEAADFLTGEGHRIVCRNWRSSHLEIDIITYKDGILHIVEVKTRSAGSTVAPEMNVTPLKRRRMVRAAEAFLHSVHTSSLPEIREVQFDAVAVEFSLDGEPHVEYYPAAFIPIFV